MGSFRGQKPSPGSNGAVVSSAVFTTRLFLLEVVVDEEGGGPLWVRRVLRPLRLAEGAPRARAPSLCVYEADWVGAGEPVAVAERPADQQKIYVINKNKGNLGNRDPSVLPREMNSWQLCSESEAGFVAGRREGGHC